MWSGLLITNGHKCSGVTTFVWVQGWCLVADMNGLLVFLDFLWTFCSLTATSSSRASNRLARTMCCQGKSFYICCKCRGEKPAITKRGKINTLRQPVLAGIHGVALGWTQKVTKAVVCLHTWPIMVCISMLVKLQTLSGVWAIITLSHTDAMIIYDNYCSCLQPLQYLWEIRANTETMQTSRKETYKGQKEFSWVQT